MRTRNDWRAYEKRIGSHLLRVFVVNEGELLQGGIGGKGDAHASAAGFFVPEVAALPHAGADVRKGADGSVIDVHVLEIP